MDIVRIFENYCNKNDIAFYYGSKSHLNLLEGSLDVDKVYLLLFPVKRSSNTNSLNTKLRGYNYSGRFLLVVNGDYAQHYFNENGMSEADSKFTENIEPLLSKFNGLGNYVIGCGLDLELGQWDNDDATNVLDSNKDGLWCNFRIIDNE